MSLEFDQAFVSLFHLISPNLIPSDYLCVYIPFLPVSMWETCHAFMPYIIGMSSRYKTFIEQQIDCEDKIILDLDRDIITGMPATVMLNSSDNVEKCLTPLKTFI